MMFKFIRQWQEAKKERKRRRKALVEIVNCLKEEDQAMRNMFSELEKISKEYT